MRERRYQWPYHSPAEIQPFLLMQGKIDLHKILDTISLGADFKTHVLTHCSERRGSEWGFWRSKLKRYNPYGPIYSAVYENKY
jgi:hypothetical protein